MLDIANGTHRPGPMSDNSQIRGEEAIIQGYLAPLAAGHPGAFGLQDDCAALRPAPGCDFIVKTDPIAEGVHFLTGDAPEDVAWKALAVNVSDLVAKGAEPRAYLMALSFPEAPARDWLQRFAGGLAEAQAAFGLSLVGGDTDRRPGPITITVTVFGEAPTGRMIRRGTARAGDLVCVTGSLGDAALGLEIVRSPGLADALALTPADAAYLVDCYRRPRPDLRLIAPLRALATAAMDISDGLVKDLGRMCRASGVGAEIAFDQIPFSRAAEIVRKLQPDLFLARWSAGDDYRVLFAAPADRATEIAGLRIGEHPFAAVIGRFTAGGAVTISFRDGTPVPTASQGWDHF